MMKKNLLILAVAAAALASCSSDEVVSQNTTLTEPQQKEISFFALNKATTRAAAQSGAIEGTTFPTTLDMKVTAWEQTNSGRDFFGATDYKYQYAGGTGGASHSYWGGVPAKYWPLSPCYINFLAITNANDDNETDVTWGNSGTDTYASKVAVAMEDNYAIGTKQHDFLYAIGHGQVTQSGNALSFPDKVDMTFKHAQAYLVFQVKAADVASTAIKIKNIEIYGARFAGTATINHTNYNAQAGQATTLYWNPTTQTNEYKCILNDQTPKANEGASTALTTSFVQMGKIIVVPNMSNTDTYADNGTTKIKITYYLDSKDYAYEYTIDNDTYEAGKKYVYDITFKLHEIFINPSVQDWTIVNREILPSTTLAELKTQINSGKDCSGYIGYYVDASGNVLETDVSAIGVIAAFTNSSTDADGAYPGSRIYVIAKSDGIGTGKAWASSGTTYATSGTTGVTYGSRTGYSQTSGLYTLSNTDFPAAKYAWEYQEKNGAAVITGSSGWFLPSEIQMVDFAQNFSKLSSVLSLSTYYWTSNQADATTSRYVYIRPDGLYANSNQTKTYTYKACPCFVY